MASVIAHIDMPDEDSEELLKLLRQWEQRRPAERHMRLAFTGAMSVKEVKAMVHRVAPSLDIITIPLNRNHG